MLSARIEEVQTIFRFRYADGVLVCSVLQDELLKVEESTLVVDLLTDLYTCSPCVLGC